MSQRLTDSHHSKSLKAQSFRQTKTISIRKLLQSDAKLFAKIEKILEPKIKKKVQNMQFLLTVKTNSCSQYERYQINALRMD